MTEPLDDLYLEWLYVQVAPARPKANQTFWSLLRQLYTKEFVWLIPNDDNRLEDGRDLRYEFRDQSKIRNIDTDWLHLNCSMLELLVGLSRRLTFEGDCDPSYWFWQLLENIGLANFDDKIYSRRIERIIEEACETVLWRSYSPSGSNGGLFPLSHPEHDQREVELWYQLSAYLLERL